MRLMEFFFGKKVIFSDKLIGNLETRIKNQNVSINCTWTCENLLESQKRKTVFILEGNRNGPYKNQLKSVHRIIQNLENITRQIYLSSHKSKPTKDKLKSVWVKDFYLAAITPNDIRENSFELNFEPINKNDNGYISFIWTNDRISNIELK